MNPKLITHFDLDTATLVPRFAFGVAHHTAVASLAKRFSLRTLLIATTLIAVVLGLTVWANP